MAGNTPMLVLRLLLAKRSWHSFAHLVSVETFDDNEYRRIYQQLAALHEQTEGDVPVAALRSAFAAQYVGSPANLTEMELVLDRLEGTQELQQDLVEALVKRFLERSTSLKLAGDILATIDKPDFSVAPIADTLVRAMEVSTRVTQTVTNVLTGAVSGAPDNRRVAHPLGVSRQLDIGLRGGVARGELLVYLAGPNVGKTAFLCGTGAAHAAGGGRVLHVTLEINSRKVAERYDEAWTHRNGVELEAPEGQEAVRLARSLVSEAGGHVWTIDWAYLKPSASDIGARFRQLRASRCGDGLIEGADCQCGRPREVDMVIVDYLALMAPDQTPGREMRQSYQFVIEEIRKLARNLDVPICTAWQSTRAAHDTSLLSMADVAECYGLSQIADIIVGLQQNTAQRGNNIMVANIVKQRESGVRGVYQLYFDTERMVIRDWGHEDDSRLVNVLVDQMKGAEDAHRG